MQINGREVGLRYTVGTNIWLQDFSTKEPDAPVTQMYMLLAVKMSEAYARGNGGEPLTEEELLDMDFEEFKAIKEEIDVIMKIDSRTTVEAKAPKGKKTAAADGGQG